MESEATPTRNIKRKDKKFVSCLIRMDLNKLELQVKLVLEKAERKYLCKEITKEVRKASRYH